MMTPSPHPRRPRGFTLIELLTSTVVLVLVLGGVGLGVIGMQSAVQSETETRSVAEAGRVATTFLSRSLANVGYGLDPRYALDLTTTGLPSAMKDNYTATTSGATPVTFVTDDLAFRYRDSGYAWRATLDSSTTRINLDAANPSVGMPLALNQTVVLACVGASDWAVFKLSASALSTATFINVTAHGAPFPGLSVRPCMLRTGADAPYLMLVHQARLRVVDLGGRPHLVVFHNLNSPDPSTNTDFDVIAPDVEVFQVAYVMNRPSPSSPCCAAAVAPDTGANWVMGDTGDPAGELPAFNATAPTFEMAYNHVSRFQGLAGNVRALRVTLVVRAAQPKDAARKGFAPYPAVENATMTATPDGYYRSLVSATIRTPNLASRSFFTPPVINADLGVLNVGGG